MANKFFLSFLLLSFPLFSMFEPSAQAVRDPAAAPEASNKKRPPSTLPTEDNKRQKLNSSDQKSDEEEDSDEIIRDSINVYPFSLIQTLFQNPPQQKIALKSFDEDDVESFNNLKEIIEDDNFISRIKKFEKLFSVVKIEKFNSYLFWIEINQTTSCKVYFVPAGKNKTKQYWIRVEEFVFSDSEDIEEKPIADLLTAQFNPQKTLAYFKETGKAVSPAQIDILEMFIKKIIPPLPKPMKPKVTPVNAAATSAPKHNKAKPEPQKNQSVAGGLDDLAGYVAKFKQPSAVERMEVFWQNLPHMHISDEHRAIMGKGNIFPLQLGKTNGFLQMVKGNYYSEALDEKNFPECAEHEEKDEHHYHWKIWEVAGDVLSTVIHMRVCEHMGELIKINKGTFLSGNEVAAFLTQLFPLFRVPIFEFDDMHIATTHMLVKNGKKPQPAYLNAKIWDIATGNLPWYVRKLGFTEVINAEKWKYSAHAHENVRGIDLNQNAEEYFEAIETIKKTVTLAELYTWYDDSPSSKQKIKKIALKALKDQGYNHSKSMKYTLQDLLKAVSLRQRNTSNAAEQKERDQDSFELTDYLLTGYIELEDKISAKERAFRTAVGIINDTHIFRRPVQDE